MPADSVAPTRTVPDTVGAPELTGADGNTSLVATEYSSVEPPSFVAVTSTRRYFAKSSVVGT